jgi:hypothetical protein
VQSRGNTFPQILDEGWAVANQGCPERELDRGVMEDAQRGLMPPLENRLTRSGFRKAAYGGRDSGYVAGGSWVAWLLARYGSRRFMALVNSATPANCVARTRAVYGRPFSRLEHAWLGHIAREFGVQRLDFSPPGSGPEKSSA